MAASLQSFLLVLPVIVSTEWVLGGSGESCAQACSTAGLTCSAKALHERNAEANSEREVAALMRSFNENCTSYNLNYGSNTDVPAFQKSNGECYISDISRQKASFNCDRNASVGKQRLCWCHATAKNVATVGCAENDSDDSAGISTSAMIWIISGNMLALGLVCMCCGVLQRLIAKCQGKPEEPNLSTRPEDPGIFVRCPACGCPLERTHATGTATFSRVMPKATSRPNSKSKSSLGLRQGDVMSSEGQHTSHMSSEGQRTSQTVTFRDEVSEVSQSCPVVPKEEV
jgi:hypothetical protein